MATPSSFREKKILGSSRLNFPYNLLQMGKTSTLLTPTHSAFLDEFRRVMYSHHCVSVSRSRGLRVGSRETRNRSPDRKVSVSLPLSVLDVRVTPTSTVLVVTWDQTGGGRGEQSCLGRTRDDMKSDDRGRKLPTFHSEWRRSEVKGPGLGPSRGGRVDGEVLQWLPVSGDYRGCPDEFGPLYKRFRLRHPKVVKTIPACKTLCLNHLVRV